MDRTRTRAYRRQGLLVPMASGDRGNVEPQVIGRETLVCWLPRQYAFSAYAVEVIDSRYLDCRDRFAGAAGFGAVGQEKLAQVSVFLYLHFFCSV